MNEWACGFFLGSVADWIAAVGAVFAAIGTVGALFWAIKITRSDAAYRSAQRHEQALSAAALMRADLLALQGQIDRMLSLLRSDATANAGKIHKIARDEIDKALAVRHGDRLSRLPVGLVVPVSDAVGSISFICNLAEVFQRIVATTPTAGAVAEKVLVRREKLRGRIETHLAGMVRQLGTFSAFNNGTLIHHLAPEEGD